MVTSNDIIKTDFDTVATNMTDIYQMFIKKTNIEKVGEEQFVLSELIKGTSIAEILTRLKERHPGEIFTRDQVDKFLERNGEALRFLKKEGRIDMKKHLLAKEQVDRKMAGMIMLTENLLKEAYDSRTSNREGFNNALKAINSLNSTISIYLKFAGYDNPEKEKTINVNIVQQISENKSSLSNRILEADFKEVVDVKVSPDKKTNI